MTYSTAALWEWGMFFESGWEIKILISSAGLLCCLQRESRQVGRELLYKMYQARRSVDSDLSPSFIMTSMHTRCPAKVLWLHNEWIFWNEQRNWIEMEVCFAKNRQSWTQTRDFASTSTIRIQLTFDAVKECQCILKNWKYIGKWNQSESNKSLLRKLNKTANKCNHDPWQSWQKWYFPPETKPH